MEPKIIFEDETLLVLDKPSGMVVNNAESTVGMETVQDWIVAYGGWLIAERSSDISEQSSAMTDGIDKETDFYKRAGMAHRIDKETSGILLVAKTLEAFVELQRQFKEREVHKRYLALAHGHLKPEEGEINVPVGRLPWNRERFGVLPGGREARTKYKVLSAYHLDEKTEKLKNGKTQEYYSLVELEPETGRTHQIRIHLQYLGYPIVSDEFYAGRKQAISDRKWCARMFLHAAKISFVHPKTKERVDFTSPLPPELEQAQEKMISFK